MFLTEISLTDFENFCQKMNTKNFFQSSYMKKFFDLEEKENYLVGLKDENNELVAGCLLVARNKFLGRIAFEAVKGFILDYNNKIVLEEFTKQVFNFIRIKKGYRLIINPYLPVIERDTDANIVEGGINNQSVINNLEKIGYHDIGAGVQVKWTYVLEFNNRNSEELFASFKPNTRNYINRTINKYVLEVDTLDYKELNIFKKITSDTCTRRGFDDRTLKYYQDMYTIFGDLVTFKVVSLNCDEYIKVLKSENKEFKEKIKTLSDGVSNKKKKIVMENDVKANLEKIKNVLELKQERGNKIPLSGAMFMMYGDEVIYLFSGSYKELMNYCGQYRLQWEIIKYAADNGFKRYNFFGINDVFDKNGKDYGVYEFKKGFNGNVEELMDVYEYGKGLIYKLYRLIKKVKH